MRFLYNNLLDSATLSNDGTIPGFGLANLQDPRLSRVYRSLSTADNIVIDLGAATAIDTFTLAAHNIASREVTLEANATDSWATPAFSLVVGINERMGYEVFTAETHRYWRVVIDDPTNTLGQIQIGRIGIGAGFDGPLMELDMSIPTRSTTERSLSRTRQSYANEGKRYRAATVTFPFITEAQKASFDEMFEFSDTLPVFVDLPELSAEQAMYANLSGSFDYGYRFGVYRFSLSLNLEEVF